MTPPVGQDRPNRLVLPLLWFHPPTLEATVATITDRLGPFTGQVGPVRFVKGVATTEDPDMVAYFAADPDRYDVETDDLPDPDPED